MCTLLARCAFGLVFELIIGHFGLFGALSVAGLFADKFEHFVGRSVCFEGDCLFGGGTGLSEVAVEGFERGGIDEADGVFGKVGDDFFEGFVCGLAVVVACIGGCEVHEHHRVIGFKRECLLIGIDGADAVAEHSIGVSEVEKRRDGVIHLDGADEIFE